MNSNPLTTDKRIWFGARPDEYTSEFNYYVNLTDDYDSLELTNVLRAPIKAGHSGSFTLVKATVDLIIQLYNIGNTIYIHCSGGHGRSGMIAAIVIGKLMRYDTATACDYVRAARELRGDCSCNFIPIPETAVQVSMVHRFLGGMEIPDRSDMSWLKRLKRERREAADVISMTNAAEDSAPIYFYDETKEWGYFSNFYESPFIWNGYEFATAEHAYQSAKYVPGSYMFELVRGQPSAYKAKVAANGVKGRQFPWVKEIEEKRRPIEEPPRNDWNKVKCEILYDILLHKFTQNSALKRILLATGNRKLIEHVGRDRFWGDNGLRGNGENVFGNLLMRVRDTLRGMDISA